MGTSRVSITAGISENNGAGGVSFSQAQSDAAYSERFAFLIRFDPMISRWISLVPS